MKSIAKRKRTRRKGSEIFDFFIRAKQLRNEGKKFEEIGEILNRHHSTIIYYIYQYDNLYRFNKSFREKCNSLN